MEHRDKNNRPLFNSLVLTVLLTMFLTGGARITDFLVDPFPLDPLLTRGIMYSILPLSACWMVYKWSKNEPGWRHRPPSRQICAPLGSYLSVLPSAICLPFILIHLHTWLNRPLPFPQPAGRGSAFFQSEYFFILFIAAVFIGPFVEEYIFRGIILENLLSSGSKQSAINISALLFSFAHVNPDLLLTGFLAGLLFGWLYVQTRSLAIATLTHAGYNASLLIFYYFTLSSRRTADYSFLFSDTGLLVLLVITALALLSFRWSLRGHPKRNRCDL